MNPQLYLLLGSPENALHYNPNTLDKDDQLRSIQNPAYHQRKDWQVSRYLKQECPQLKYFSLSHKKGFCALLNHTFSSAIVGIDIEARQHRNFLNLSQLCCTDEEQKWLAQQENVSQSFYTLWTLKEAFIKCTQGALADMKQIALIHKGQIQIPPLGHAVQAYSTYTHPDYIISVIYPKPLPPIYEAHYHAYGVWKDYSLIWHAWKTSDNA